MSVWVKVNLWYQDEESPASTHGRLWRKRWRVWAVNTMSQRSTYSSWLQVTLQPVCSWMIGGCSFFPVSTPHYIQQNQQWTVRRGTDTAEVELTKATANIRAATVIYKIRTFRLCSYKAYTRMVTMPMPGEKKYNQCRLKWFQKE